MDLNQLKSIQSKLSQITQSKVELLLKEEILENGKEIVQRVKERWRQGLRPDGNIIGTYRNFAYEMEKRQRNPLAGGKVDLIDTGALSNKLVINYIRGSLFTIFSDDNKATSIAQKYGLDVFGLTKEEEQDVMIEAVSNIYKKLFEFVGL